MHHLLEIWFGWVLHGGYVGIIVLMAMESSIFPVPSEIVIPPAAFLAAQGHLSFTGVILAGTLGSYLGAAITYWVSLLIGRPFVHRFGKYFFVPPEKLERAEVWLQRYEAGGVFFARLLPVIRHLISIPAGIVRMNFWIFSVVTIAGSALWCTVLAYLGDKAYRVQPDLISNPDALLQFIKAQSFWIVLFVAVLAVLYLLVLRLSAKPASSR
ncbi:MAG TPA: DedA family protein [Chthoniobacterales bacterium]|nr:DedA family protein [Chthoniobacterales bacterium]